MNPYRSPRSSNGASSFEALFAVVFTFSYLWMKFDYNILDEFWEELGHRGFVTAIRAAIVSFIIMIDGLKFLIPISWLIGYLYGCT